jgi:DNA primase
MNDVVEKIKERLTIFDVVSPYVELQKAGKNYKGKSPFTNEKTPSFYVSPDRNMYYCFSSNQGGDIFTFIEKMEGVDFKGALKILADKAGIELVPEDPKKRTERDTQYALIEEATKFFFNTGMNSKVAQDYVLNRGVDGKTLHAWRIGFAPDAWRSLKEHLTAKGYTEAEMLRAGLVKKTDDSKDPYDVFRNRIMFPISDSSGRVVAFSGRTLDTDPETPKYVNSPETELFVKSDVLFGYHIAKQSIRQYDFSLLVEGQFDLVLAHQAGYTNAVAVSGTALTEHHIELLQRLSNRAVLALDSDRAGVAAMKRAADLMLRRGIDVKVARIEGGKDPADIIKEDAKRFKKMVGEAIHVIEALLSILKKEAKDERAYKLRVREEVIPILAHMPNRIDREHFEGVIAEKIGTTKDGVHFEVERIASGVNTEYTKVVPVPEPLQTLEDDHPVFFASMLEVLKNEDSKKEIGEWLHEKLTSLCKDVGEEFSSCISAPPAYINEYTFRHKLDEWAEKASVKEIKEKLADSLTQFHRGKLTEAKRGLDLELKDGAKSEEEKTLILEKINAIIQKREAAIYAAEL